MTSRKRGLREAPPLGGKPPSAASASGGAEVSRKRVLREAPPLGGKLPFAKQPRPKRKGGGQPGNRNALKHALYARFYPEETKKTLLEWDVKDYIGEVHLLRVSMEKMAEVLLVQEDIPIIEKVAMLNGIVRASSTVSLLVHRHQLLNTRDDPVYIAWEDTTRELDFFTDGKPPE